ncbi:hypothetical protein [Sciscionella marina]|nr:hypothetical protein [Sciscionella marina]
MDEVLIALISGGITLVTGLSTLLVGNRRADRAVTCSAVSR